MTSKVQIVSVGYCPHPVTVYTRGHIRGYKQLNINIIWVALYYLVKIVTFTTPNIKKANPKSDKAIKWQ